MSPSCLNQDRLPGGLVRGSFEAQCFHRLGGKAAGSYRGCERFSAGGAVSVKQHFIFLPQAAGEALSTARENLTDTMVTRQKHTGHTRTLSLGPASVLRPPRSSQWRFPPEDGPERALALVTAVADFLDETKLTKKPKTTRPPLSGDGRCRSISAWISSSKVAHTGLSLVVLSTCAADCSAPDYRAQEFAH